MPPRCKLIVYQRCGDAELLAIASMRIMNVFSFSPSQKKPKFVVRLCSDVLEDILCYGDRMKLTETEFIGRRFHYIIENHFAEKPRILFNVKADYELFNRLSKVYIAPGIEYHPPRSYWVIKFIWPKLANCIK